MSTARLESPGLIDRIPEAVTACLPIASRAFDELRRVSRDGPGVTRPSYGDNEQAASQVIADAGHEQGFEVDYDSAGNLYVTLPGRNRSAPAVVMGSHLDSVPVGGNYDGAAGVVAGLTVMSALAHMNIQPPQDLRAMGIRGEESVWFGTAYLGSGLALGLLPLERLDDLTRIDSGRTLAQHIDDLGFDSRSLRSDPPHLSAANVAEYYELHIEQGPILVAKGIPVAVATGIRGNARYPFARCRGSYDHAAAVPREMRRDTVLATADLVMQLDRFWREIEADGSRESVFTVGKFYTDPEVHGMTVVPGEVSFTLNFGTTRTEDIRRFHDRVRDEVRSIEHARRVSFELGDAVGTDPKPLDSGLRESLRAACRALGEDDFEMATAGHDAAMFIRAGIPSGMVLIRNAHGSHNPDEAMEIEDFGIGCRVMLTAMAQRGLL